MNKTSDRRSTWTPGSSTTLRRFLTWSSTDSRFCDGFGFSLCLWWDLACVFVAALNDEVALVREASQVTADGLSENRVGFEL
ncbi:hypothetical protein Q3G72_031238 [Acer saccharum]|nr:hypothetical protein Q3G72_031238 [Acer saccharum]